MTQSFKCPSCNAPLKFKAGVVQTCKFCDTDVIVPPNLAKPKEEVKEEVLETKPPTEVEQLRNASELGQKAVKIAEIKQAIKGNRKVSAAILFRDSFGGSIADAREIIESIESGKSVSVPDFQTDENRNVQTVRKSSSSKWIVFFAVLAIAIILFLIFTGNLSG